MFTNTQSNESRYARIVCILGLVLVALLGMMELGESTTSTSPQRRRLGWSSEAQAPQEWKKAMENKENIIGNEKGYTFISKKDKRNARKIAGALTLMTGFLTPFAGLVGYAMQESHKLKDTRSITYTFCLGKYTSWGITTNVILIQMKNHKGKYQWGYLTAVELFNTENGYNGPKYPVDGKPKSYSVARFEISSLTKTGRICDRWIFYNNKNQQKPRQSQGTFAHFMKSLWGYKSCSFSQSDDGALTFLDGYQERSERRFTRIRFYTLTKGFNTRALKKTGFKKDLTTILKDAMDLDVSELETEYSLLKYMNALPFCLSTNLKATRQGAHTVRLSA